MAATNYTPISLYYSDVENAVPVNTNLVNGELAINIYDGKLYYKDNTGAVQLLASKATSSNVTSVSVVSTNGFAGTVANPSTTPAITLSTTATGMLKGSTGSIIAASPGVDYAPATSGTSLLYGNGSGGFSNVTIGTGLTFAGGTLTASGASGVTTFSGGSTGLTPSTATSGAITLAGTLSPSNGGTGITTGGSNGNVLTWNGSAWYAAAPASAGVTSVTGSGINVSPTSGNVVVTLTSSNITTALGATPVYTTTTQTITGAKTFSGGITSSSFTTATNSGLGASAINLYNSSRSTGNYNSIFLQTTGTALNQQDYVMAFNNNNTSASFVYVFNGGGTATATNWSSTSDARIKENVIPITKGLDTISQLRPVEFSYKRDHLSAPDHYGLIAQELAEVLPTIVDDSSLSDGNVQNIKSVSYTELIPVLIKAVQELKAEVDALKAAK